MRFTRPPRSSASRLLSTLAAAAVKVSGCKREGDWWSFFYNHIFGSKLAGFFMTFLPLAVNGQFMTVHPPPSSGSNSLIRKKTSNDLKILIFDYFSACT